MHPLNITFPIYNIISCGKYVKHEPFNFEVVTLHKILKYKSINYLDKLISNVHCTNEKKEEITVYLSFDRVIR